MVTALTSLHYTHVQKSEQPIDPASYGESLRVEDKRVRG